MTSEGPSDTSTDSGRNKFNRRKIDQLMEIEWGSSVLKCPVRDIGPRGLFVLLVPPLWIGATFSAHLMVDPPIHLICTVRRVEPSMGMGVSFSLHEDNADARLDKLLTSLPMI
jgi:PilZ domain-containing protein